MTGSQCHRSEPYIEAEVFEMKDKEFNCETVIVNNKSNTYSAEKQRNHWICLYSDESNSFVEIINGLRQTIWKY